MAAENPVTIENPETSNRTVNIHLKNGLSNLARSVAGAAAGVASWAVFSEATSRVVFHKQKQNEFNELERKAEVNAARTGVGFNPDYTTRVMIKDSQETIDTASFALGIPSETLCNLRSYRNAPKLDDACTIVEFEAKRVAAKQAYLEPTDYDQLLPYRNDSDGWELVQAGSLILTVVAGGYAVKKGYNAFCDFYDMVKSPKLPEPESMTSAEASD